MELRVDAVTKAPRIYQGKNQWGVKDPAGKWYALYQQDKPNRGDVIEVAIEEKEGKNGVTYYNAYPAKPTPKQAAPEPKSEPNFDQLIRKDAPAPVTHAASNGKIPWADFERVVKAAHALVLEAEPDVPDGNLDRGATRATMFNTLIMTFDHGRLEAPKPLEAPEVDEWEGGLPE